MARLFDDAALQYLTNANAAVVAAPLTMSAWFYTDEPGGAQALVAVGASANFRNYFQLGLHGFLGGDPVAFTARDVGIEGTARTTAGYALNTWHHGCGIEIATNSRVVYIDGGNPGVNAANVVLVGADQTRIGRRVNGSAEYASGRIAEAGVWNVALTVAEVAILAAGYSPLFVRPQSLVAYWPLIGRLSPEHDPAGGFDMTLVNGPTQADHPRIIYPSPAQVRAIVAAPAGVPRHWMHYARQRYA